MTTARLGIIGGGPTSTALLERLAANAAELFGATPLEIHVIDPHQRGPGAGRIWRHDQSALLWMNSMAMDVTMFTDDSVECHGPIVKGPSLDEWVATVRAEELVAPSMIDELRAVTPTSFPSRRVQSEYLSWVHDFVVDHLPATIDVVRHEATALDVTEENGRQIIHLADGAELGVDVVVLALGHLDAEAPEPLDDLTAFARRNDLLVVAPGHTADLALDQLEAGEDVIVRGFGLAFIDLMVLLTEGRGGRYEEEGGALRYLPSGTEPILHVGSRRGVPYRSKIGYPLQAARAPLPRFFTNEAIASLASTLDRLEFWPHLWPLLAKDLAWSSYHELFHAHPERTRGSFDDLDAAFDRWAWDDPALVQAIEEAVPDPEDRFDVEVINDPLRRANVDGATTEVQVRQIIEHDRARRADPAFSADLAIFNGLLIGFAQLIRAIGTGKVAPRSIIEDINGWWFSFFSYFASGPPPRRLDQMLALHDAGIIRFLGPDLEVSGDEEQGVFVARSSRADEVTARALVEARIAVPSIQRSGSPLVRALAERGELTEQHLSDPLDGFEVRTGKILVDDELHLISSSGPHPARFAAGAPTNRPAAGTFARPNTNALSFRQNDQLARTILTTLRDAHLDAIELVDAH